MIAAVLPQMPEANPYKPTSQLERASEGGLIARVLLAIYSFATIGLAAFIFGGLCFLDENGFQIVPGLSQTAGLIVVVVITLICGATAAVLCSRTHRHGLASKTTVFAIVNAIFAFALIAFSAALQLEKDNFQVFPGDWESIAPAHYAMCGFAAISGIFGVWASVIEIKKSRTIAAVSVGLSTLASLAFVFAFFSLSGSE